MRGGNSQMTASTSALANDSVESTAPFSETRAATKVPSSFAKRMRLLIASGLVKGITPTSIRRGSHQGILASAFYELAGGGADELKADYMCLKGSCPTDHLN